MVTHQFHRLTVHVYYLSPDSTTDRPVLGAIVGTTGTLVVDADIYLGGHEPEPLSRSALIAEAALLRQISQTVDRIGDDRDAVLAALQQQTGRPLAEDWVESADMFLAGIRAWQ